jgi:hypothetical protein
MDMGLNLLLGLLSGVAVLFAMQIWPVRYKWSRDISWQQNEAGPKFEARIFRKPYILWKNRRLPFDVSFSARIAIHIRGRPPTEEKIIEIPVTKSWRPVIAREISVMVLPKHCQPEELEYLPPDLLRKAKTRPLLLSDFLKPRREWTKAKLRIYAFGYRPYTGSRWMVRGVYSWGSLVRGEFVTGSGLVKMAGKAPRKRTTRNNQNTVK